MIGLEKYIRTISKNPDETKPTVEARVIQSREKRISAAQQAIRDYQRNQLKSALESFPHDGIDGLPN